MPCSSTSQLTNANSVTLPGTIPTTQAQWAIFIQRLQQLVGMVGDAAAKTGVNVVPAAYAVYDAAQLPPLSISGANSALDTAKTLFGNGSLKLTATAATVTVEFPSGTIAIAPFTRWIESVYIQSSRTAIAGTMAVVTANGSYPVNIGGTLVPAQWGRLYGDCDLTADDASSATILLTFTGCAVGDTFNLEGWQLEAANGQTNLPSAFVNSAAPGSLTQVPDDATYAKILASHTAGNVAYNFRGVWSSATGYLIGDETVYAGSYWLCTQASTGQAPAQSSAYWQAVGAYNDYQGAWSAMVAYQPGMEVTYGGNFWVCAAANTNSIPAIGNANWAMAGPQSLDNITDGTTRFASIYTPLQQGQIGNTANDARAIAQGNAPLIPNGNFANGLTGWTAGSGWTASVGGALYTGFAGANFTDLTGTTSVPVTPGQPVYVQALLEASGANGGCYVALEWLNASGAKVGANAGNSVTGTTTALSILRMIAPAGVASVVPYVETNAITSGTVTASQLAMTLSAVSTLSDLPDSTTRFAVAQVDSNKRALVDFSQAAHINKNLDYIAGTASYQKVPVMQGSAIAVPNANFLAPVDGSGVIPGWSPYQGATLAYFITNAAPFTNTQCLHVSASGSTPVGFGAVCHAFNASAGDTFFIAGWAYQETGSAAQLSLTYYTSAGAAMAGVNVSTTSASAWQHISNHGAAPPGTAYAVFAVFNASTTGGSSYFYDIHITRAANLDNEAVDGTTHGRIAMQDVYQVSGVNRVGLCVAGSGATIGDQRNLLPVTWGGVRSIMNNAPITYSINALIVTFAVGATTLNAGGFQVSYNASSGSVSQAAGTTITYVLYYRDPTSAGGSQTLYISTNPNDLGQYPDIVYIGYATVATSGSAQPIMNPTVTFNHSLSGLAATFSSTVNSRASGGVTYVWDFGDGGLSNAQNPSHTYAAAGTYNVTVIVRNTAGLTGSAANFVTVSGSATVNPPTASFTDTVSGQSVSFTSTSTAGTNPITSYNWNFGDGATSAAQNPTHTYSSGGTYNVTLMVADANGLSNTTTNAIAVAAGSGSGGGGAGSGSNPPGYPVK